MDTSRSGKSLCLEKVTGLSRLRVNLQGPKSHCPAHAQAAIPVSRSMVSALPRGAWPAVLSGVGGRGTVAYLVWQSLKELPVIQAHPSTHPLFTQSFVVVVVGAGG